MDQNEIENTFKTSGSRDELFDAFRAAIKLKIKDDSVYKVLLANKALSNDEIMLYADKVCREFPELASSIFLWTGRVFESLSRHTERLQKAVVYYKKSISSNETDLRPYLSIAKMYNPELDIPTFNELVKILLGGLTKVQHRSKICFALSTLYKNINDKTNSAYYQMLGEKYQRQEPG